jgi:predicted RNA-binding Zn ribbon-like protein
MNVLWIDFVNSDWHDHRGRAPATDRLDDPQWLRQFLRTAGLPVVVAGDQAARRELKELRGLLQRIVRECVAGDAVSDSHIAALNRYLAGPQIRPRLVRTPPNFRLDLSPTGRGLAAVQFAIAASLAEFLVRGEQSRLKWCENPACQWLFYDSTRSRTRRWCASICGNLIKVRKHRQQARKSKDTSPSKRAKPRNTKADRIHRR